MGAPDPLPWAKSRTVATVRVFSFIVNRPVGRCGFVTISQRAAVIGLVIDYGCKDSVFILLQQINSVFYLLI